MTEPDDPRPRPRPPYSVDVHSDLLGDDPDARNYPDARHRDHNHAYADPDPPEVPPHF